MLPTIRQISIQSKAPYLMTPTRELVFDFQVAPPAMIKYILFSASFAFGVYVMTLMTS
ncbi:hypothetical protein OAG51_03750 [Pirellulaceae bacterium]|jgi:hypothetical protein|nr:hypothetical protein [Pirellulaceae bacterium]MDB4794515.1 hypothetical protein [Pirellulaceae bacterium]